MPGMLGDEVAVSSPVGYPVKTTIGRLGCFLMDSFRRERALLSFSLQSRKHSISRKRRNAMQAETGCSEDKLL